MNFIQNIENKYINSIKKSFLHLKDIKEIVRKIEKRGYSTSRVYGNLNVKRVTATDKDRNRIEFILSEKNLYIILSLSFSNFLVEDDQIKILTTNKEISIELLTDLNQHRFYDEMTKIIYHNDKNYEFYPEKVFLAGNLLFRDSFKLNSMAVINKMSVIRDRIIFSEINLEKRKKITEMPIKSRASFVKKISDQLVLTLLFSNRLTVELPEIILNKNFFYGYLFYKHLFFRYSFTYDELELFFKNYIPKYIEDNKEFYFKKYLNTDDNSYEKKISYIVNDLFSDIYSEYEEISYVVKMNDELMIESETEIMFEAIEKASSYVHRSFSNEYVNIEDLD